MCRVQLAPAAPLFGPADGAAPPIPSWQFLAASPPQSLPSPLPPPTVPPGQLHGESRGVTLCLRATTMKNKKQNVRGGLWLEGGGGGGRAAEGRCG